MPKFVARLEDPDDSRLYRRVTGVFDSEHDFRLFLQHRELEYALFGLEDGRLAELEAKDAAGREENPDAKHVLGGKDRAELVLHRQANPYVIVSVEEVE